MKSSGSASCRGRFRVAGWTVDVQACRLVRGRIEVSLRPLLVDLLSCLAARAGEVVTKDELVEQVWQGRFLGDSVLTRTMTELRQVLGDDSRQPTIIETIRKRGYRLIAHVEPLDAPPETRLAVLPFENLNGAAEYDYFAAGISDALTTELGNIAGLQVISRQSVVAVMRSQPTVSDIARTLRVDVVLEGSALHAGDRVRITAQLIQAFPERHLWAESYVSDMGDILHLQGRVARAVAEAVQARLSDRELARLTRRRNVDPEAHLAYMKGRYQVLRWDREGLEKGFAYVHQALEVDPDYAPAHALLALAFTVLGYWGHLPVSVAYPRAKKEGETAVRLDPSLGEAHALVGAMRWFIDWDLDGCEAEMRLAVELSPSSELAHGLYALFLAVSREAYEEALVQTRMMLDLDPLSMSTGFFAAWLYFFSREYERAVEQARSTLHMYPDCIHAYYVLGWVALGQERYADAVAAFESALAHSRDAVSLAYVAVAYARAGRSQDARVLLSDLLAMRTTGDVPEFLFALIHSGLGDRDQAIDSLDRVFAERDSRIFWFKVPAIAGTFPGQARFDELMRRLDALLDR